MYRDMCWPNGQCAGLQRIEWSGVEPWPGHCVGGVGKTL